MTTPRRRILLVDCDAFFVQVARLEDPDGAGQAQYLLVGGSPTGRGVVTSASYEARTLGVRSAMPTAQALRLCPTATVVPVPRGAVERWSRRVRAVLDDAAPVVQAASVDEFYLDLTGTERLFAGESLADTADRIRRAVLARTGIDVSIGGGTRRIIAKLATRSAKPSGVHIVAPGAEDSFLRTLDLSDIPGIGPSLSRELADKGLMSVDEAWEITPEWWRRWFGERRGQWLHDRIRGIDEREVDPSDRRVSISSERTFSNDISDDEELRGRLLGLCASVTATLRAKGFRARTVTVKLRDHDFSTRQRNRTLAEPLESDAAVHAVADELLADLRNQSNEPVRLLGVGLSGLAARGEAETQLDLFGGTAPGAGGRESERDRLVSHALDEVRGRFGDGALVRGRPSRRSGSQVP